MSRSWGHTVWPIGADEAPYPWPCSTRGCNAKPTHCSNYRYVTGRAGRVSDATRHLCPEHAERFAVKHNAKRLEASPGTQREFTDAVVGSLLGRTDQGER